MTSTSAVHRAALLVRQLPRSQAGCYHASNPLRLGRGTFACLPPPPPGRSPARKLFNRFRVRPAEGVGQHALGASFSTPLALDVAKVQRGAGPRTAPVQANGACFFNDERRADTSDRQTATRNRSGAARLRGRHDRFVRALHRAGSPSSGATGVFGHV
jgi:hypothetical protein